jgi:branched-chain amino acid transport system ATP-binding protein
VTAEPDLLLRADRLTKRFGRLVVLDEVSLTVADGEALGIVGPNGAGKSTLLDVINGVLQPDAGTITFAGRDVTRDDPARRCRAGIGRSYQIPRPFAGLTTFENVLAAATFGAGRRGRDAHDAAAGAMDRAGLTSRANTLAGTLPLLDRKRLELARAMATRPRLILLDEIAGGLTEAEVPALVDTIRRLPDDGVTVVWIEHIVHALLDVVNRLVCLANGRLIAAGAPSAVLARPDVQEVYLGTAPTAEGVARDDQPA